MVISKPAEKNLAIQLRKQGKAYSEILALVPVAKSTLSLWLRDVGLARREKQRLTQKKLAAGRRGGAARKKDRVERALKIFSDSESQIKSISKRELWLIGVTLYWGEGSKEKAHQPGSGVLFTNSDPGMLKLFLLWLIQCCGVVKERIHYEIYLHDSHKGRVANVKRFWYNHLRLGNSVDVPVYYKRNKLKTKRKNIGEKYFGLVRIKVRSSSELQRQIAGWIMGICKYSGVV